MADIRPFVATRYAPKNGADLSQVLTPPYDVIDPALQQTLLDRHPNNLVRVDFGRTQPNDDDYENRYTRAGSLWQQWKKDGTLVEDVKKCVYVYEQEFTLADGKTYRRRGFFAAVHLEDFSQGGIRAHEHTFDGPKADRFRLMRATNTNLSPIFCVYDDAEKAVDALLEQAVAGREPVEAQFDGVIHRMWPVCESPTVKAMRERMADKTLFIADGHHRYETSLNYRNEMRSLMEGAKGERPFDFTMMFLANIHDEGMVVLPTHRVLSKEACHGVNAEEALEDIKEYFDVKPMKLNQEKLESEAKRLTKELAAAGAKRPSFIVMVPKGRPFLVSLKQGVDLDEMIDEEAMPPEVKALDVTILHSYLIGRGWLGNPEIELDDQDVIYVKDPLDALQRLCTCKFGAAFLMNPTRIEQVCEVARAGQRMPHKSTYFYPKVVTGMVMRDLDSPW
jgi:uncharacterized protein (DUF1015 family)